MDKLRTMAGEARLHARDGEFDVLNVVQPIATKVRDHPEDLNETGRAKLLSQNRSLIH